MSAVLSMAAGPASAGRTGATGGDEEVRGRDLTELVERFDRPAPGEAPTPSPASSAADGDMTAAAFGAFGDGSGDVPYCEGDLVQGQANYETGVIGLNLTTRCFSNPNGANWYPGITTAAWFLDTNADGFDDFEVFVFRDSVGHLAAVTTNGGSQFVCGASPGFSGNVIGVTFDPTCIGRPDAIQVQAGMLWDESPFLETCACPEDYAPDGAYSAPVAAPPIGNGPGAASPSTGVIDVFARGQDNALWTRHNSGTWAPWNTLGGIVTSTPGVASKSEGTLDVFVRGQDAALWSRHFNGTTWGAWYSLGGILSTAAGVTSSSPGTLDVFVAGQDRALWRRHFDGVAWGPWSSLGGIVIASPAAASSDPGTMSVFVRGQDSVLWTRSFSGGFFGAWSPVGGRLTSAPSATSSGSGALEVFARGVDRSLVFWQFSSGSWSPQTSMGGFVEAPPAAVSATDGNVDVFIRGADSAMWTNHFVIGGGQGGWHSLGGVIL